MLRSATFRTVLGAALLLTLLTGTFGSIGATEQDWDFLPVDEIGGLRFLTQYPQGDGRGTVLFVLDTGVDMGIPGLLTTSTGQVKVIGARDMTPQGKVKLTKAEWVEDTEPRVLQAAEGVRLTGMDALTVKPSTPEKIYTGVLEEDRYQNSDGLDDVNDNGSTDDRWGVVVYAAARSEVVAALGEGQGVTQRRAWGEKAVAAEGEIADGERVWLCVIDVDRDGHLDDEIILRDYATGYQSFTLRDTASEDARDVLTFALDLGGDKKPKLKLHHDDGGHGSHVAGIAAGFGVHGQEGLNGVAPGAWVYSLKLGDNRLSGGATTTESMKKAFDFAAEFMETYDVPCVINMSYGIGSETEGDAKMDVYLDDLLDEHSKLVVCTSAGNAGPGLSNVGLPAAADAVIANAAMFNKDMAAALYGAQFDRDQLYLFSSRGGELAKPDVAAPGGASSTVPLWGSYERYQGTSMASPMTAGSVCCMLSVLDAAGKDWTFGTVKRALMASAKPLPGYTRIEAGAGVVDLPAAYGLVEKYSDSGEAGVVTVYSVRTTSPHQPDGEAPAAYWRGGFYPTGNDRQAFRIHPRFASDYSENDRNKFYRAFSLKADVPWIRIDRGETYINGDSDAVVSLSYSGKELAEPGFHVGRVLGTLKGGNRSGGAAYEFELVVTIVTPERFDHESGYERTWKSQALKAGSVNRSFVAVPPGASSMELSVTVPDGKEGYVRPVAIDPAGRNQGPYLGYADSREDRNVTLDFAGEDLTPGVWEVCVRGSRNRTMTSTYDLMVSFSGLSADPKAIETLEFDQPGDSPGGELAVIQRFEQVFRGSGEGEIDRWQRSREIEVEDSDVWTYEFEVDSNTRAVEFDLEMTPEVYNLMTDCAVNIYDGAGDAVVVSGFGTRFLTAALRGASPGTYKLEVTAGLSFAADEESWSFEMVESFVRRSSIPVSVMLHGDSHFILYPEAMATLDLSVEGILPIPPDGFINAGEVRLVDGGREQVRLRIPVRLQP